MGFCWACIFSFSTPKPCCEHIYIWKHTHPCASEINCCLQCISVLTLVSFLHKLVLLFSHGGRAGCGSDNTPWSHRLPYMQNPAWSPLFIIYPTAIYALIPLILTAYSPRKLSLWISDELFLLQNNFFLFIMKYIIYHSSFPFTVMWYPFY